LPLPDKRVKRRGVAHIRNAVTTGGSGFILMEISMQNERRWHEASDAAFPNSGGGQRERE
jgi:hypothetical protein